MAMKGVVFRAALVRVLLGLFALFLLPLLYPRLTDSRPIFVGYVAATLVMQFLIWKDIGGQTRSFVSGLIDLTFLTWIVHRVGSISTAMVALYLFTGTMNSLVVSFRVGMSLAGIGTVMYVGVLVAEAGGLLPYGPDAPAWASAATPGAAEVLTAGVLVGILLNLSAGVTGYLVHTVRSHEAELEDANRKLEELSQRDPLTQLYNRRHLLARLEAELARARRGRQFAVIMIDLDGFKRVNDTQGHLRGDMLLTELSQALEKSLREIDVAGRYGGDEFLLVLPDTDAEQARAVAERVAATVRSVGARFDPARPVTASLGVAIASRDDTVAALLRRSDENAYRAKESGGDRVVVSA